MGLLKEIIKDTEKLLNKLRQLDELKKEYETRKAERIFSWDCPKSPDYKCHYFTEEPWYDGRRVVYLSDGRTYGYDGQVPQEYESEDCCLFCGEPYERK